MNKTLQLLSILMFSLAFSQVIIPDGKEMPSQTELEKRGYKMATYPGGMEAFRNNFAQIFDHSRISSKGRITTEAQFIVSEEGIINDIVITGDSKSMNREMERAIKKMSKTKWQPAELDGKPVKYRFRLPITMSFE